MIGKQKNYSNKDIDPTRTHLNFYCKENETTYIREFDRMKKEYDLQGNLRKNSIIMCQMMITSDNEFFLKIGLEETKKYFRESYKFVCNYKNLGEKNIISAANAAKRMIIPTIFVFAILSMPCFFT